MLAGFHSHLQRVFSARNGAVRLPSRVVRRGERVERGRVPAIQSTHSTLCETHPFGRHAQIHVGAVAMTPREIETARDPIGLDFERAGDYR